MFSKLFDYFLADPLRILYLIGGSGGILFVWDRWKNRIRLRIELLKEHFSDNKYSVSFEVENLGSQVTSLDKEIVLTGLNPKMKAKRIKFEITSKERTLNAHVPTVIEAVAKEDSILSDPDYGEDIVFYFFRQYKFKSTKGRTERIRFRIYKHKLGFITYRIEKIFFRLTGKYRETKYS